MIRQTTASRRTRPSKHDPGCPANHTDDLTCEEHDRLYGDCQQRPANWSCSYSTSRTQPEHVFDFGAGLPDTETECVHGCGVTWDRMWGAE